MLKQTAQKSIKNRDRYAADHLTIEPKSTDATRI